MASCCCIDSSEENDDAHDDATKQRNRNTPKAPSQINMSRGDPIPVFDEDIQAVKAWRDSRKTTPQKDRNGIHEWQESSPPLQRTPRSEAPDKSKMATLESIEVDDLSTVSPSLKYAGRNLATTTPNNMPPLCPSSDRDIQRTVSPSPVASVIPPVQKQQSDEQSLGTIEGLVVSDELQSVAKGSGADRHASSPSHGGQRIWAPTTVGSSLSPAGKDPQRFPLKTVEFSRVRSASSSSLDTSKTRKEQLQFRMPHPGSNARQIPEGREQSSPHSNDSFSGIPSGVGTEVREQYTLDCSPLKTTLTQKEKTRNPVENAFLRERIQDSPREQIAVVSQASQTLMSDTLFRVSSTLAKSTEESSQATESEQRTVQRKMTAAAYALDEAKQYPFRVLGNAEVKFRVLTPMIMEALRGFLPMSIAEDNFWLKFSFDRDGGSLMTLLSNVRTSTHTIVAVETTSGFVFGVFCSTPWRVQRSWFGSEECFIWRLKHSRHRSDRESRSHLNDNEMEVYPYTGHDNLVQFVTNSTLAVGGGDWDGTESNPFPREPTGIGFTIDGDLLGGETNSCATFASPRLCGRLTNNTEFEIESIEIWTLTPCETVEDAEIFETRTFFVDSNRKQA